MSTLKFHTLNKGDFKKVFEKNFFFNCKSICLWYCKNDSNTFHYGVTAGKKYYNAVYRNKIKRILRTIVADQIINYNFKNCDFVIIGNKHFFKFNYNEHYSHIMIVLKKLAKLSFN